MLDGVLPQVFEGRENHYIILALKLKAIILQIGTDQCFLLLLRGQKQEFIFIGNKDGLTYKAISNR